MRIIGKGPDVRIVSAAFVLFLLACQSAGGGNQPSDTATTVAPTAAIVRDTTTLAGRWYLQPVLPSDTATGKIPWLDLNPDLSSFSGNTGCNSMHGKLYCSKTDSSLSFSNKIVLSRRACPGFNEPAFLKSLQNTGRFKLRHDTLILVGDDRSELSRWLRKPAVFPKVLKT